MANSRFPSGGGSGTPGGSDTQVQFNNAGAFGGIPGSSWDGTSLSVPLPLILSAVDPSYAGWAPILSDFTIGGWDEYYAAHIQAQTGSGEEGDRYNDGFYFYVGGVPTAESQAELFGFTIETQALGLTGQTITEMRGASAFTTDAIPDANTIEITKAYNGYFGSTWTQAHVTDSYGIFSYLQTFGGTVTNAWGNQSRIQNFGGTITNAYSYYADDLSGVATNGYYAWYNSRGVFRVREDSTFDGVGQAIPALYNPQFTKYIAGAADYERWVTQWNGNVLEMGAEKGGTGTLRALKLLGASVSTDGVFQAGGYKSSDGSTGATGSANNTNTLTIKNGLVVAIT